MCSPSRHPVGFLDCTLSLSFHLLFISPVFHFHSVYDVRYYPLDHASTGIMVGLEREIERVREGDREREREREKKREMNYKGAKSKILHFRIDLGLLFLLQERPFEGWKKRVVCPVIFLLLFLFLG